MINRVALIVLDSVGVGELPDASEYGDVGSNTVKNIYKNIQDFKLPNLEKLGLLNINGFEDIKRSDEFISTIAKCNEKSKGKDTTTGHWEISGVTLEKPFPTYPNGFPDDVIEEFEKKVGRKVIGNCPASGTEIIKQLGDEHVNTGNLIVYTSADSVFQVASHEDVVPLDELYKICEIAREMLQGKHGVGRVIARPFTGESGNYTRTKNRKDFSLLPPKNMLDYIVDANQEVYAIGKIEDIFVNRGITKSSHTSTNEDGINETIKALKDDFKGLIFTNLVDFDMMFGHRNDVEGYGNALKYFDDRLPEIMDNLRDDDLLIITADHGCDPTTPSTDHSREYIPLILYNKNIKKNNNLGTLETYACIGKTILDLLNVENNIDGYSIKNNIF